MIRRLTILLLFVSLIANGSLFSQNISKNLDQKLDALFDEWKKPGMPGGVAGIVQDGQLIWAKPYGLASLEYDVANTTNTLFNVASVSKQFTAFSMILLEQQGKLSLDDNIRKYLPEVPDFGQTITIRHLLHHTSGLRNFQNLLTMAGWREGDPMNGDDLLKYIARQRELNFAVGSEYLYCNTGFNLCAEIVQRVTGKTFLDWTKENIFQPLGMNDTEFREDVTVVHKNTATSYDGSASAGFRRPVPFWTYVGNGNIHTTLSDLTKWLNNFSDPTLGGPEAIQMLTKEGVLTSGEPIHYALGIGVSAYRGLQRWQHGGSIGGYRASLSYYPDQAVGFLVLSNFSSANPGGKTTDMADLYLADAFPEVKSAPSAPFVIERTAAQVDLARFDDLVGAYWLRRDQQLVRIKRKGNQILAETQEETLTLVPASDSTLFLQETAISVLLHRETNGKINRLTVYSDYPTTARRVDETLFHPKSLEHYTGEYYSPELNTSYSLIVENGRLLVRHQRHPDFQLFPIGRDQLSGEAYFFSQAEVKRDASGQIEGLRVSNGRVRNLWFEKR